VHTFSPIISLKGIWLCYNNTKFYKKQGARPVYIFEFG